MYLKVVGVGSPLIGNLPGVRDEQIVEVDVVGHGPKFDSYGAYSSHLERLGVIVVVGVGNLAGLPLTLVVGIVNEAWVPFA